MAAGPVYYKTTFPPTDLGENVQIKLLVAQSPQEIRYITYPATSFSQANANFAIIPPSPQTIISRRVRIQVPVTVTINGTLNTNNFPQVTQANVWNTLYAGFCDFPIHKSIATLTVQFNNQSTTIRPSQIMDKLLYYCMGEELVEGSSSQTPSQLDNTQTYDMTALFVTSPFATFGDSHNHISRNSFPINVINNPTVTPSSTSGTATLSATFTEPLMISPLIFDEEWYKRAGITQLTQILVNIVWDTVAISRMFRHDAVSDPVIYNSVSVTLGQPSLILGYYTLPNYMTIPPILNYNYSAVQNFIYVQTSSIAPGNSVTLATNTIQFQSIPRRVYIAVQKTNRTLNDPDAFLPITNVNVTWGNTSGLLSTLNQQDIYYISRKNGLVIPWSQASGQPIQLYNGPLQPKTIVGTAFPVCLEFGSDIQLLNETYVGMSGTWNFFVQVTCFNPLPSGNITPELHLVVIYDGYMTINNQNVSLNVGLLRPEQGFSIPNLVKMPYPPLTDFYMGGAFSLSNLLSGIGRHLFSGIKGLLSGLLFGEQPQEGESQQSSQSSEGIGKQLAALLPYIRQMMASRSSAVSAAPVAPVSRAIARRSLEEQLEE